MKTSLIVSSQRSRRCSLPCACEIKPPLTVLGTEKEASFKAAAVALPGAISNAQSSGNYKTVVSQTYATVDKDDLAFYLLLQAYNCESQRGHKEQAEKLLQAAREELARRRRTHRHTERKR